MTNYVTPTVEQAKALPVGTELFIAAKVREAGLDYDGELRLTTLNEDMGTYAAPQEVRIAQDVLNEALLPKLPTGVGAIIQITAWGGDWGRGDLSAREDWSALRDRSGKWHIATDGAMTSYTDDQLKERIADGRLKFTVVREGVKR